MKILVGIDNNSGNYIFDTIGKTVTITGINVKALENVYLITNVTKNVILYNFADPTLGATLNNNIITLTNANLTGMSDSDRLQILVEISDPIVSDVDILTGIVQQMALLTDVVKSLAQVDAQNRQRVVVDSGSIIVTSGSITATASAAEIGKVTQTYSDAQVQGEIAFDVLRTKLSF